MNPYLHLCNLSADFSMEQLILDIKCGTNIRPRHLTGTQWRGSQASKPPFFNFSLVIGPKKVDLRAEVTHRSDRAEIQDLSSYHNIFSSPRVKIHGPQTSLLVSY